MALAVVLLPVTPAPFNSIDNTQKIQRAYFKVTASGNYISGGEPLNLSTLGVSSASDPIWVDVKSARPAGGSGYTYQFVPVSSGTYKLQIMVTGAAGPQVDLAAGAYPAGVTGDTIIGYADYVRL